MLSTTAVLGLKSTLLCGWREKWSDERWSIAVKCHIPSGLNCDSCQLAGMLAMLSVYDSSRKFNHI